MYIHPDGSTTGSVNQAVLDAYNQAKADGADLSEFAPFLAENSPEAKAAQGAPVSLPGGQQASPEAQAADERVAAQSQAAQESSDQRSADLAAQLSQSPPVEPPGVYDPSDKTVAEVQKYLATASPEEQQRVLDAEASGKARATLLGKDDGGS
jgi:hypothetical protein